MGIIEAVIGVLSLVVTIGGAIVGWYVRSSDRQILALKNDLDNLERRFDAHRLFAAETFTTKGDFKHMENSIMDMLRRIEDKIDRKADR